MRGCACVQPGTSKTAVAECTEPHDGPSTIARGILSTSSFIWLPACTPHQSRSNSEVVDAYLTTAMRCPRWHIRRNALCDHMRLLLPQETRERLEKDIAERKTGAVDFITWPLLPGAPNARRASREKCRSISSLFTRTTTRSTSSRSSWVEDLLRKKEWEGDRWSHTFVHYCADFQAILQDGFYRSPSRLRMFLRPLCGARCHFSKCLLWLFQIFAQIISICILLQRLIICSINGIWQRDKDDWQPAVEFVWVSVFFYTPYICIRGQHVKSPRRVQQYQNVIAACKEYLLKEEAN